MRSLVPLSLALAVAACASPSSRIADVLVRYGLDEQRAQCVGGELERRLSAAQLMELNRVARAYRENDADPARLTPGDLIRVAGELQDRRIPVEVGRAGFACGVVPGF